MAQIIINNSNYTGKSVTIVNGKVIVDGKDVTPDSKEVTITVNGDIESLSCDYTNSIEVNGNVGDIQGGSGNIKCMNVTGDVKTGSGNVRCGDIGGDAKTGSGNVTANNIRGSVKTGSGSIDYNGKE